MYTGEDCIKMFCESLAKDKMETINFKKRKMIPLTNKEYK